MTEQSDPGVAIGLTATGVEGNSLQPFLMEVVSGTQRIASRLFSDDDSTGIFESENAVEYVRATHVNE